MYDYLKIRDKNRRLLPLLANRAQREYKRRRRQRNVVLKARQLGITTYVAARFFLQTITHPGTLSVQVAHDQESAEEIFRVVHRFWENLPKTFAGRGHCEPPVRIFASCCFQISIASIAWKRRAIRTRGAADHP